MAEYSSCFMEEMFQLSVEGQAGSSGDRVWKNIPDGTLLRMESMCGLGRHGSWPLTCSPVRKGS